MILALEMFRSVSRLVAAKAVGGRIPGILSGPAAPLRLVSREQPEVSRPGWARIRVRLSGICGSDLGALSGRTSLYFSGVVSMPFVPGHEVVGDLVDDCEDLPAGTRVVLDPVLACAARGVEPCVSCREGATNRCDRVTVGHLSPGLQTGYCADTGGGWSQVLLAHRSQLHAVPETLPDEQAVLVEPLACAAHTALRARVSRGDHVLVSGAGSVGLFTTLALRQLTQAGDITVVAKHAHQRDLARAFGATDVVVPDEALRGVRRSTRAFHVRGEFGRSYLLGGVDIAIDAVGSKRSVEQALHATRAGGRVVLSGMPAAADLSAAWFRELEVIGSYASASREPAADGRGRVALSPAVASGSRRDGSQGGGAKAHSESASSDDNAARRPRGTAQQASGTRRDALGSFDLAMELAAGDGVADVASGVVSYQLHQWREALDHAHSAGRLGTVKVTFDPRSSR